GYLANLEFRVKSFFSKLFDPMPNQGNPRTSEPAVSKETTKPCQAILSKKVLLNFFTSTSEFLRTLQSR
ncbi:hypothetical protein, partial [Caulobacter flavus]|uniref:hypothetical protein n=1 Tax=Caulobacter flavus TaxID=1679497 RepID=UPI001C6081CE